MRGRGTWGRVFRKIWTRRASTARLVHGALFKQWPALFACNYRVGDLTLATLHLYSAVRHAPLASRFASRFAADSCILSRLSEISVTLTLPRIHDWIRQARCTLSRNAVGKFSTNNVAKDYQNIFNFSINNFICL